MMKCLITERDILCINKFNISFFNIIIIIMNNNFLDTENFKYLITFVFNDIKQRTSHDISNNKKYISIFKKLVQTIHKKNMNKRVSKEYLNTIVIDKCVPFIIKQLNNETEKQNALKQPVFDNRQLNVSNRPSASRNNRHPNTNNKNDFSHLTLSEPNRNTDKLNPMDLSNMAGVASRNGDKLDYNSQLNEYQTDRNYDNNQQQPQLKSVNEVIGQQSNYDEEKIDYIKKLQELQNDRNYETQNNNMDNFETQNNIQNIQNHTSLENVNSQNVEIDNEFMNKLYENNQNNTESIQEINNSVLNKLNNNYFDNDDDVDGGDNELVDSYPNVQLNILDKSKNDRLPDYNSNIDNLKIDYSPEKINSNIDNVKKELYQTTKQYTGVPSHLVVLENHFTDDSEDVSFKADLIEPLNIDRPADIFLEFINLQNIDDGQLNGHLEGINCFALQIDELNIKTASNNNDLKDKYIIPNDSYGTTDNVADAGTASQVNKVDATSYNIKLKSNYMCSIKPMEITSLNIKLYSLKISTLALLQSQANGKIIIGLFIKKNF
jgi:hypothetical protein